MKSARALSLILAVLVVGALCVRLTGNGVVVMRPDESFSWRVSTRPGMDMLRDVAADTHPPAHFVLLKLWQALFGSSLAALRCPSALCGGLTAIFAYLAVVAALKPHMQAEEKTPASHQAAGLLAAALVALHAGLIGAGQTARMYALAATMAGVTAWAMREALAAPFAARRWWCVYGFCAAGLLYSHHYGWFTLAAQFAFALGVVLRRAFRERAAARQTAGGLLLAVGVAFALYSPWLPVFLAQAQRVHEGFWVPAASAEEFSLQFLKWLTGLEYLDSPKRNVLVGFLIASAVWRVVRRDGAAIFFLWQAAAPWAATLAVSTWGHRPLLQERYLLPADVAIAAYLAIVAARVYGMVMHPSARTAKPPGAISEGREVVSANRGAWFAPGNDLRLVAALGWVWLWGGVYLYGCLLHFASVPAHTAPIAQAAQWLRGEYQAGDQVRVSSAWELNQLRYYAEHAGLTQIDLRCHFSPLGIGQQAHVASLHAEDVMYDMSDVSPLVRRVWSVSSMRGPPGWRQVRERAFVDGQPLNGGTYKLTLYEREKGTR